MKLTLDCLWIIISLGTLGASSPIKTFSSDLKLMSSTTKQKKFDEHRRGIYKPGKIFPDLRPAPSDDLPVLPLNHPEPGSNSPSLDSFDPHTLQEMIGDDYDEAFMSSVQPLESILHPNGTLAFNLPRRRFKSNEINLSLRHLPSADRKRLRIKSERTKRKVQRMLAAYSSCPVLYTWRDLGSPFWPRWIREGSCSRKRSCSVPVGMQCQPSRSLTKTILYWHCGESKPCDWIRINYPIITECKCSC